MLEDEFEENERLAVAHLMERWVIEAHALEGPLDSVDWQLYPVDSPERAAIAGAIARYFHRETPFDFPPYSAGDEGDNTKVFLARSGEFLTVQPVITGAVGLERWAARDSWVLTWIWVHPQERGDGRGGRLITRILDELEREHGELYYQGDLTRPMQKVVERRGAAGRVVYG